MRHRLTEADEGTAVSARVGDAIEICLHEMPSGGYRWLLDAPCDILEQQEQSFAFDKGSVGGRNETRLLFRVKAIGSAMLKLRYARSWESAEPPAKIWQATIEAS